MDRSRLELVIKDIYIPKLKAKFNAPYMYAGETLEQTKYLNKIKNQQPFIFNNSERSKNEVILGIESSFDESAACLVNSYGELFSKNIRYTQPALSEEFNGGVDPKRAEEHHKKWLPIAIEEAM